MSIYDQRPWLALYDQDQPHALNPEFDSLLALFDAVRQRSPQSVAVTYFDEQLTYCEVDELSDGLARYLSEQKLGGGDRLAVYLQNIPQFVLAVLAGWKVGVIVVPLNPMYRSHELTTILTDAQPSAIVSSEYGWHDVLGPVARDAGVPTAITTSELDLQHRNDPRLFAKVERRPADDAVDLLEVARQRRDQRLPRPNLTSSDIALLVYTSGTSGVPKGATNTHGNVAFNSESFTRRAPSESGNTGIFGLAPLFHITGLVCQLGAALAQGWQLDLTYRFEPGVVLDGLREHAPGHMIGPSTAYMALMNHPEASRERFASLEQVYSGGAPLPSAVVESFRQRFGHYIRNGYGLTETTATATSVPTHREAPVDASSGTLSVGIPTFDTILRIVGEDGADLAAGEVGEIVIEGPMVVPAYWNNPAETERGIPDGRLHTGDVGFMDQQGWFYVVDRKKDMISASGYKVWPREVEDVLYEHPAVREVAVVGVPDSYRGETVKAYVSLRPDSTVVVEELVDYCKQQLAAYKSPREVEVLDDLPKTTTGKILRRQLRDTGNADLGEQAEQQA